MVDEKKNLAKKVKTGKKHERQQKQKPHYSIQMMFNTFPFGRWPVAF